MIVESKNFFEWAHWPQPFPSVVLIFVFILLLSPYLAGLDFGIFKIPIFSEQARRSLRIIGPGVFFCCALLFVPFFGSDKTASNSINQPVGSQAQKTSLTAATSSIGPAVVSINGRAMRNGVGLDFVLIPAGEFYMGSRVGANDNERPVHRVTIRQPFYFGKTEVTQEQWSLLMGPDTNPSHFRDMDNLPVEQLSWEDAQTFINKMNQFSDGFEYRLPSESEWEYACRAGSTKEFQDDLYHKAWYLDNSADTLWQAKNEKYGKGTHPVATKQPNAFGLYDMNGNVWEWCRDEDHPNYDGAPADESYWLSSTPTNKRAARGGSWGSDLMHGMSFAYRNFLVKSNANNANAVGFRVVAIRR